MTFYLEPGWPVVVRMCDERPELVGQRGIVVGTIFEHVRNGRRPRTVVVVRMHPEQDHVDHLLWFDLHELAATEAERKKARTT